MKQSIYNHSAGKQERSSVSTKHQNERLDIPKGHTNIPLHTNTFKIDFFWWGIERGGHVNTLPLSGHSTGGAFSTPTEQGTSIVCSPRFPDMYFWPVFVKKIPICSNMPSKFRKSERSGQSRVSWGEPMGQDSSRAKESNLDGYRVFRFWQ